MIILRIIESKPTKNGVRLRLDNKDVDEPGVKTIIFDPDSLLKVALQAKQDTLFVETRPVIQVDGVPMHLESVTFKKVFVAGDMVPGVVTWASGKMADAALVHQVSRSGFSLSLTDTEMWMVLAWE